MSQTTITTERDAFLAAIAADPKDQAPKLIYADWLEEQGDTDGAAYYRGPALWSRPPTEAEFRAGREEGRERARQEAEERARKRAEERVRRRFAREVGRPVRAHLGLSGKPHPIHLEDGFAPPRLEGRSYYWTTPSGLTEVRHPNAYKWPTWYRHSTLRIVVGIGWLIEQGVV